MTVERVTTCVFIAIASVVIILVAYTWGTQRWNLNQRYFPCQEDEVLGYAERYGHDHVGCIHLDEITEAR